MSILKVPSTQVLMSGRGVVTSGKAGSSRRGHENSGNIPVDLGAIAVITDGANCTATHPLTAGQADVGAYQFSLLAAADTVTNQTITITCPTGKTFGGGEDGGIVVEHLSTLGTEKATMNGANKLTKFPGYGSVAFDALYKKMTYQRLKGTTATESLSAVNVYIRLGTQTLPLA